MIIDISTGVRLIQQGQLVAFPTETVYGLWANAFDIQAVQRIFITKGRPQDNPLIVHLADTKDIPLIAQIQNTLEQQLIDKRMPWPLTLLLHNIAIPDIVTAWHDRVGIRIPTHPLARNLIRQAWLPICAPSANISGRPSPTTADMVASYFGDQVPVIDGWACLVGIESTVVWVVDDEIIIYRPWAITAEMLRDMRKGLVSIRPATIHIWVSPGTRYRHYAPQCQICCIPWEWWWLSNLIKEHFAHNKKIWLLVIDGYLDEKIDESWDLISQCTVLSRGKDFHQAAQRLYSSYQKADSLWLDIVYVQVLTETGLGAAIMNRVRKSCERL